MDCGPAACCNGCNYGFALLGTTKRVLDLHSWEQAPPLRMDCDLAEVRTWLPKLVIIVSGVFVDQQIGWPDDPLGPPPSRKVLAADRTCRVK